MTDEEFEKYLNDSLREIEKKQDNLQQSYGLGSHERFVVDYESGKLTFFEKERPLCEASIVTIASHVQEKNSLKWAWANEAYPDNVREESSFVKELYEHTGYTMFKNEGLECDDSMAWEISALACSISNSIGVYRIPHSSIDVYVVITSVQKFS